MSDLLLYPPMKSSIFVSFLQGLHSIELMTLMAVHVRYFRIFKIQQPYPFSELFKSSSLETKCFKGNPRQSLEQNNVY